MVVIGHYTARYNDFYTPINFPFKFSYGGYGVQLFFLISGFVIFLTLNKTRHPLEFVISRFSRLYPAYWVSVLLTFTFISIFSLPDTFKIPNTYDVLVNLTMLQRWFRIQNVDPVYWTLAVELSFYIIMFLVFLTNQLKKIEFLSIVYLTFIISTKIFENHFGITIPNVIKVTFLLDYGNLFIAGIMFYKIIHKPQKNHYFILLACLFTEYFLHSESNMLIAAYFLIFYLFTQGKLQFISIKPLLFLGSISYSLYLTHQFIGYILIDNLYRMGLDTPWLLLLIAMSLSIALAGFMRAYIEKPTQNWIRSCWHRSKKYQSINLHIQKIEETR
jgi:peptidoglycan/LPS O-acetylase OafA/YrhL